MKTDVEELIFVEIGGETCLEIIEKTNIKMLERNMTPTSGRDETNCTLNFLFSIRIVDKNE